MFPGIALYLFSIVLFTTMSALVHKVSDSVPLGQVIFWRSSMALVPIMIHMTIRREFPAALKTGHPGKHVTRSLVGMCGMTLSFLSLRYLHVANAQALGYLAPILVLPMAVIVAREKVSWLVISATTLGFAGVIAMVWESLEVPGNGALIGVSAGFAFAFVSAFVKVHIKTMTRTERPVTIAFYFTATGTILGLASLPLGWVSPDGTTLLLLAVTGLIGGLAQIAVTEAVARAPVSSLAPLDYTGLILALGFDVLVFATPPGPLGLAGAVTITIAVLVVTLAPHRAPYRAPAK
ncbi:DMT family transporter [Tropicimonas sp. IMCC34043]|uniref:DMT family transporter n=1 Tax=Tropicimonas sp. IMCC34043 TaxID=2248760 RepID=UPI000E23811A|nr:DMT family transporter [Tropicimonas sp. IMCC34043]